MKQLYSSLQKAGLIFTSTIFDEEETFILIESGSAVCKHKTSRHAHIFIIETRWQKAWLFSVLGMKNTLLALRGQ